MSLYEKMRKENARCLTVGNGYLAKSRLLEDIKAGKEPEKKHKTLDSFFENPVIVI